MFSDYCFACTLVEVVQVVQVVGVVEFVQELSTAALLAWTSSQNSSK